MLAIFAIAAVCLSPPVDGPVTLPYLPIGQYAGHWGIDYGARPGETVRAPTSGRVTFAGSVAGMRTITIEPVEGFKVSVSYLATVEVSAGQTVTRGQRIATAGRPHGEPGVHMSLRIGGVYVNPAPQIGCRNTDLSRGLRLLPPPQPYPRSRAYRDSRRNLRPDSCCPPPRRGVRPVSGRARPGPVHARGRPLAEDRTSDNRRPAPFRNDPDRRRRS